jgi:protoheme IX farnesyltransferase
MSAGVATAPTHTEHAASARPTVALYIDAVKPGIVLSNTIVTAAAYVFAAHPFSWITLLGLVIGTSAIVGSGCVLNNHADRDIDARMERTASRGQVTGAIGPLAAGIYCAILGLGGAALLLATTNVATLLLGAAGWVLYSLVYTPAKHHTVHATLIGTVPGAIPPVAGIAAAGGDPWVALTLFAMLVAWQLAHFYSISIRRRKDYGNAAVPVPAVAYGVARTIRLVQLGAVLFLASSLALWAVGPLHPVLGLALVAYAVYWLLSASRGVHRYTDVDRWANAMFAHSLLIVMLIPAVLVIGRFLG